MEHPHASHRKTAELDRERLAGALASKRVGPGCEARAPLRVGFGVQDDVDELEAADLQSPEHELPGIKGHLGACDLEQMGCMASRRARDPEICRLEVRDWEEVQPESARDARLETQSLRQLALEDGLVLIEPKRAR